MRTIPISDELFERAEAEARRRGISVEEFLTGVIERHLAKCEAVRAQMTQEQWAFIGGAERATLFGIVPEVPHGARSDELGSYPITATQVLGQDASATLAVALYEAMLSRPDYAAGCFVPRHAMVFERGAQRFEILLCFECAHALYTDHTGHRGGFPIGPEGQDTLDRLLGIADPEAEASATLAG